MINVVLQFLLLALPAGENWPSFLGTGAGTRDVNHLPLTWSPDAGIAWIRETKGHGQSSPVCWNDKVFVTSVDGPNKETYFVTCLNIQSGEILWTKQIGNSVPVKNSYYVSRSAPTPVVNENGLVVLFESGDLIAFSHDGQQLWQRQLSDDFGPFEAEFGLGASLCQSGNVVVALLEHDGPGYLLGIDESTGQTLWQVERDAGRSWSSPAIVQVGDEQHIVVSSNGSVKGYRPADGTELWSLGEVGGNTGCTPIDCGKGRFLVGASPGRNGENAGAAADSNCLVKVQASDNGYEASKVWVAEGAFPTWASPIVHQGLAYWVNRSGVVYCFDAETGELRYSNRTKESCWATPYGVGDRVYFFGKDGMVTVINASPEFEILSENQTWTDATLPQEQPLEEEETAERRQAAAMFSQPTLYGYAVTTNGFLIRVGNALICIRKE